MIEKVNSFIDMYEELLLLAKIQAKAHACKEGYDYETITDVYLIPYGDDIIVTYHVKPQEGEFIEEDALLLKRFIFETVQGIHRMITERQIKTYRNTQEKFKKRAYELVKEYEQHNLGVYDKVIITDVYFIAEKVFVNYEIEMVEEYSVSTNRRRCDMSIKDFSDPNYTIGEVRRWHQRCI